MTKEEVRCKTKGKFCFTVSEKHSSQEKLGACAIGLRRTLDIQNSKTQ